MNTNSEFLKRAGKKEAKKHKLINDPLEETISDKFKDTCNAFGFVTLKLIIHNQRTFPDWTVINKNGVTCYVELKRKGRDLKVGQAKTKTRLTGNNAPYYKIDNIDQIHSFAVAFSKLTLVA